MKRQPGALTLGETASCSPDGTLIPSAQDQGHIGDLPDVLAWPAEPS